MAIRRTKISAVPGVVARYQDCPAKTYHNEHGVRQLGRSVFDHCYIVGEVARQLISRSAVRSLFPKGSAFVAACHDIGKVSPTFYNKLYRACNLPELPGHVNPDMEKGWGGHAGVSQITAKALGVSRFVPEILGGHHGFAPNVAGKRAHDDVFGGDAWQTEREKLVNALQEAMQETWPEIEIYPIARLLAGLTSVADWIGSGSYFDHPAEEWQSKIAAAVDNAGFILPRYQADLSFDQVFGFDPWPIQQRFYEQVTGPGVYVLEAPMGLGKTEAALYAAYRLLAAGQAGGIYFALPTQLTSNKIYSRFEAFLTSILHEDCEHRPLLLHANAWLVETEMGEEGQPGGAWFNQAKRGLLAPFAVGTIDQALMAAMNVKHGFVRAFGLAGKVVILDEVHTYDAYTGTILSALIAMLMELECTIIVLSATLSQERRQELMGCETGSKAYPLVTAMPRANKNVSEVGVVSTRSSQVSLSLKKETSLAVEEALIRAEQGQQVLWIENTVRTAQERYLDLASRAHDIGVDCGLLHSRFTFDDRRSLEDKWVNLFGKLGWLQNRRQECGRILVGTQVLEQSLDIDADFLVSRFAPTDMILQRLGRLWRHSDTPRSKHARYEAWLLAPELDDAVRNPIEAFGASAFVYSPYVLCRSLEVWGNIQRIKLPNDIRRLIDATYQDRQETGLMATWLNHLKEGSRWRTGQNALERMARLTLAETGQVIHENRAQTRYGEISTSEVLLLQRLQYDAATDSGVLTLMNGSQVMLPLRRNRLSRSEWRKLTARLMHEIAYVPAHEAPKEVSRNRLMRFGLHHCFYLGNPLWPEDESIFRVALVDEADQLVGLENQLVHDKYKMEYRPDMGYRVLKD